MSAEGRMFLRLLADHVARRMKGENVAQRWNQYRWWTEMMLGSSASRRPPLKDFGVLGAMAQLLGYTPQAEYLRVDQIWYFGPGQDKSDWLIDAYLEHEHNAKKLPELVRKLLAIGGGLKVAITYLDGTAPDALLSQVGAQISARYGVADDMRLLVAFGFLANANLEWEGYMFDGRGRSIALHGAQRIRGA